MFDEYMTLYNSAHDYMPILAIVLMLFIIISRVALRYEMHRMRRLESDIISEHKKLMHERVELERRYHMYM